MFINFAVIVLLMFLRLSDLLKERHFLYYKFTVLTRAGTFPEFSAVCVCDDRRISHFSNKERVWIGAEDWTEAPPDPPDPRDWFIHQIRTLSDCTDSQCSELHVLQRIIGCELEKLPDGSVSLTVFDEYGFDGEDLISFNSDAEQWIDKSPKAKRTKEEWDLHTGRNQVIKYFLKTCADWISGFHNTKKQQFGSLLSNHWFPDSIQHCSASPDSALPAGSPDVHMFACKAPDDQNKLVLTCLATGFCPRDVQMEIRLSRTKLEDQTSELRPNDDQTFQMRTSVKIDRNHKGSYDCLVIHSSLREPALAKWGKYRHYFSHSHICTLCTMQSGKYRSPATTKPRLIHGLADREAGLVARENTSHCSRVQWCSVMLGQEGAVAKLFHKVGSMKLSKIFWYAEALRVPFTGTKGPSPTPEKQP
ncbi:patr class I histocompatibility antigen, B-2 alpha chain-like isoform X2 [Pseudorasbora parva]|uniref:patr class I histocompatibility antigen, B-2 alpha chain-like isoform X2 n=1 Tax=Pseudorasbora parva TaxID=51549 RepID=UPI00351EA58C